MLRLIEHPPKVHSLLMKQETSHEIWNMTFVYTVCISGDKTPVLAVLLLSLLHIKSTSPLIQHTIFLFFSLSSCPSQKLASHFLECSTKYYTLDLENHVWGFFWLLYKAAVSPDWRDAAELHSQSVSINKTSSLHTGQSSSVAALPSSTPAAAAFGIEVFWMWSGVKVIAPKGTISEHEVDGWSRVEMWQPNVHRRERHRVLFRRISCLFSFKSTA